MSRRWWVNHKQTVRQETGGGYLWSPKTEANGGVSQFYNNMVRAEPGDLVLSYADGVIGHVGCVTDFALTAPKPETLGSVGGYWGAEGWLLPTAWTAVSPSIRPKDFIDKLGPLLPAKYSPIDPESGNGRQKAYLAEISSAAFDLVMSQSTTTANVLTPIVENVGTSQFPSLLDDIVQKAVLSDPALDATEKEQVVKARKGQGIFRSNVCKVESACRVTGVTNPNLLIASHIKPWRSCETSLERLDGHNGFLMTPDVDRLFDRGFITFESDGAIRVSPRIPTTDLNAMGVDASARVGAFTNPQEQYLAYHRASVFMKPIDTVDDGE